MYESEPPSTPEVEVRVNRHFFHLFARRPPAMTYSTTLLVA